MKDISDAALARRYQAKVMAQQAMAPGGDDEAKKKRVGKACDGCRMKKTKCDGRRPCSKCTQDKKLCTYSEKKKQPDKIYSGSYVELLEYRTQLLQDSLIKLVSKIADGHDVTRYVPNDGGELSINKVIDLLMSEEEEEEAARTAGGASTSDRIASAASHPRHMMSSDFSSPDSTGFDESSPEDVDTTTTSSNNPAASTNDLTTMPRHRGTTEAGPSSSSSSAAAAAAAVTGAAPGASSDPNDGVGSTSPQFGKQFDPSYSESLSYMDQLATLDTIDDLSLGPYKSAAAMAAAAAQSMQNGYGLALPDSPVSVASSPGSTVTDVFTTDSLMWPAGTSNPPSGDSTVSPAMLSGRSASFSDLPNMAPSSSSGGTYSPNGHKLVRRDSRGHLSKVHRAGSHFHQTTNLTGDSPESGATPYFIKDMAATSRAKRNSISLNTTSADTSPGAVRSPLNNSVHSLQRSQSQLHGPQQQQHQPQGQIHTHNGMPGGFEDLSPDESLSETFKLDQINHTLDNIFAGEQQYLNGGYDENLSQQQV